LLCLDRKDTTRTKNSNKGNEKNTLKGMDLIPLRLDSRLRGKDGRFLFALPCLFYTLQFDGVSPFVDFTIKSGTIPVLLIPDRFTLTMFARFFHRCWLAVTVFFFLTVPLWAQESTAADAETQEWVLSYALMLLFLGLTLLILLRPTRRNDSAFSYDELQAQKEEELKKMKGG